MNQFIKQENKDGVVVHTNVDYDNLVAASLKDVSVEQDVLTVEDIAKVEISTTNKRARKYLASTDWYITRQAETGAEVPADVLTKRAEARASVENA
jgi:hypothetical protein